ncbi:hypothetical protein ARTHROSP310_19020 [Arthrobacter sp. AD-310]
MSSTLVIRDPGYQARPETLEHLNELSALSSMVPQRYRVIRPGPRPGVPGLPTARLLL